MAVRRRTSQARPLLTPLASAFGAAYRLGKADVGGCSEEYDVLLHGRETSCTCPGHNYRGKCKHVEALQALIAAGKLPAPPELRIENGELRTKNSQFSILNSQFGEAFASLTEREQNLILRSAKSEREIRAMAANFIAQRESGFDNP